MLGGAGVGILDSSTATLSDTELLANASPALSAQTGAGSGVLEVQGGLSDAQGMMGSLSGGPGTAGYPGPSVMLPGGGFVGLRVVSRSGPPTIDVNIPGFIWREIKFVR
jgi:hypothetical protein